MLVFQALPGLFHVLRATRRKGKAASDAAEGGAISPEGGGETPLRERAEDGIIEVRGGWYIQGPDGKIQGSLPEGGSSAGNGDPKGCLLNKKNLDAYMEPQKTKYAKSPQRSKKEIQIGLVRYNRLCSQMMAIFSNLDAGERVCPREGNKVFAVVVDGSGGLAVKKVTVKSGGDRNGGDGIPEASS